MVAGAVPKPPMVTPHGGDYPSNYTSATTGLSWKAAAALCGIIGILLLIVLFGPLIW